MKDAPPLSLLLSIAAEKEKGGKPYEEMYPGSGSFSPGRYHHYHYFEKETDHMKKKIRSLPIQIKSACFRAMNCLTNERGDFYISDGVKIIIAVVLGALLLAALTTIFNDTVIPRITSEIEGLFN